MAAGSVVARNMVQAYKEAAARSAQNPNLSRALRRKMNINEAEQIMGVEAKRATAEEIMARYKTLYDINAPSDTFKGSPFLQRKVGIARDVFLDSIRKNAGGGAKPGEGAKPSEGKSEL